MVIGKVILKSPWENTMIRKMPLKDSVYPSQYESTHANVAPMMLPPGGGMTQYPAHFSHTYHSMTGHGESKC